MWSIENEDAVGAAPTGDAPTTSEWSTILLPTKVCLVLEVWRYGWLGLLGWDATWYTAYNNEDPIVQIPAFKFPTNFWAQILVTPMWMKSYMVEIGRHDAWVSSITAWSTTIPRFLCELCQCIKIKPTNVYYIRARAQFKINTQGCWNQHSFKTGCPVPPRPDHWSCVFGTVSVAWNEYVGQMAAGDVASVWG